jgi:hypothetical protein
MSLIASGSAAPSPTRPWPADRIEHWPIERLIAYANNPRLHSEADLDKIAASIGNHLVGRLTQRQRDHALDRRRWPTAAGQAFGSSRAATQPRLRT